MAFRLRHLKTGDSAKLFGVFLIPIAIGIMVHLWYPWLHQTAYAIADALIVAGVIGLLIEFAAAKFLIQKVSDDLSEKLIGRGLPKALQNHIGQIVKTSIVREDYCKTYKFDDPTNGKVRIEISITFRVKNFSETTIDYIPGMDEEALFDPIFQYLEYGLEGQESVILNEEGLKKRLKIDPITKAQTVDGHKAVNLSPISIDSNAICQVRWKYALTHPENSSDVTAFRAATLGVRLWLDHEPETLRFSSSGDTMRPHGEGSLSWEFSGPFIGGQHIRTWWFRK